MSNIQSVLIPVKNYSLSAALKWLDDNGYQTHKIDATRNYYRFRQQEPLKTNRYFTKEIANSGGIKLVIILNKLDSNVAN